MLKTRTSYHTAGYGLAGMTHTEAQCEACGVWSIILHQTQRCPKCGGWHGKPRTYAEAVERYRAGRYTFNAPPVPHARWSEADWIKYVWGIEPEGNRC